MNPATSPAAPVRRAVVRSLLLSQRQRSTLPQTLIFFITSRCNARCGFCLYYEQITNPVAQKDELTVAEVLEIARRYGPLHYLALSGGEPFVRKDVGAICQAFIDCCGTSVIDIPSNFYYTDRMVETLTPLAAANPGVLFDLQMSIDQLGSRHDESRKVKNLYATALRSFAALEKVRAAHPNLRLKVNVVYLDSNREELGRIVDELARELRFDRIQVTYPTHLVPGNGAEPPLAADVDAFLAAEKAALSGTRLRDRLDLYTVGMLSVKGVYHRLLRDAVRGRPSVGGYCEAGRHLVVINEKGDVFPCEPLWRKVGNLRESGYDLRAVLEGPEYQRFRAAELGPGKCNCTWGCAMHTSISVRPRHLPALGANALKILATR